MHTPIMGHTLTLEQTDALITLLAHLADEDIEQIIGKPLRPGVMQDLFDDLGESWEQQTGHEHPDHADEPFDEGLIHDPNQLELPDVLALLDAQPAGTVLLFDHPSNGLVIIPQTRPEHH